MLAGPLARGGFIQWVHVDGNLQRPLNVARNDDAQREELQRRGQYKPVRRFALCCKSITLFACRWAELGSLLLRRG